MKKLEALKQFFGTPKPLTTKELIDLRKSDPVGFDELASLAAAALGSSLDKE